MKVRAIIPAAGFGTRMKMKPNQSKEMLEDKIYGFKHIIDYSLKICADNHLDPLVIIRKEKKDLKNYLKKLKVEFIEIEPEGEWNQTVLQSVNHWYEDNILILPDTRFSPEFETIRDIKRGLKLGNQAVFAVHEVSDPEKWGVIKDYRLHEKSNNPLFERSEMAWGLIGFKYYNGYIFVTNDSINLRNSGFVYLKEFKDITRK